jgi:hypothetical protein
LTASTTYYYRVRANNAGGDSAYSNTASATTQSSSSLPGAPTGLTVTSANGTTINLMWTDTASNETGFQIERSPNGTKWRLIATVGVNAVTYTDLVDNADPIRYYRVRAVNGVGNSAYSNVATLTWPRSPAVRARRTR